MSFYYDHDQSDIVIGYDFLGKLQIMHKTERTSKISCSALVKIFYHFIEG